MFALLDMDCFYAQVESLRLKLGPEVPLGMKQHDHFIAVNYAARKHGVPSRCAVSRAMEICPDIVIAEVEMLEGRKPCLERYRKASEEVIKVLLQFVNEDQLERASIDEAYIDLSSLCSNPSYYRKEGYSFEKIISIYDDLSLEPEEEKKILFQASTVLNEIRIALFEKLGFTSSCGIAHNKLLAKIAASQNKPNGQTIVFQSGAQKLVRMVKLSKIPGLGAKLGKQLESLKKFDEAHDYNVLYDIQRNAITFQELEKQFGTKSARFIISRALGEDNSLITPKNKPASLLCMKSFPNHCSFKEVEDWLRLESEELAYRVLRDYDLHERFPKTLILFYQKIK